MPTAGGQPTRVTYHPGIDAARGWSPDGRQVIFASTRDAVPVPSVTPYFKLWAVAGDVSASSTFTPNGPPVPLPMPRAFTGTYSPDGRRMAYEDVALGFAAEWAQNQSSQWRHYRG